MRDIYANFTKFTNEINFSQTIIVFANKAKANYVYSDNFFFELLV